jgi:diguanylate cyclase (GGDEF)-like protein/PAS domain S-box-containing protein
VRPYTVPHATPLRSSSGALRARGGVTAAGTAHAPSALVRTLLASVAEGVVVVDRHLRCRVWNHFMEELTGIAAADVLGREALDAFPYLRRRGVGRLLNRALDGETVRFPDTPYRVAKTGRSGWVTGQYAPHRGPDGSIVGVVGIVHDITERKRAERSLKESEERLRALIDSAAVGIAILDGEGRVVAANPSLEGMLGYAHGDLAGTDWAHLSHPDDREAPRVFHDVVQGTRTAYQRELRLLRADGQVVWGRMTASAMRDADGEPWLAVGMVEDVTERHRTREENERLAAFVREAPHPVLECDAAGRVLFRNPAAARLEAEAGPRGAAALLPPNHAQLTRTALESGKIFRAVEVAFGERIFSWTYHPQRDLAAVHLFAEDITGRRAVEEQLRHEALHDALTGLPNRLFFMERLARAIVRARRDARHQFAVLFADLDRFKVVNDGLGHHVGDDLLVAVALRIQNAVRDGDTVARFGGDEFAILLEDVDCAEAALEAAARIQAAVSAPVSLSGYEVFTSASIGVALSSAAYGRPEYLVRNADMAMYRAKAAGTGRCEVFDRAMHADALLRLQTETDLRRAAERGEFRVFYQPIVSLPTGALAGMEALVRWKHPDRGWVQPPDFVPAAEETGVIFQLGRWVLDEACRQLREWQRRIPAAEGLSVSVNLSVKQFAQADMVDQVRRAVEAAGLDPRHLKLEITESVIVDNLDSAAATLARLKAMGITVHMDDFGTGYSSLSSLHRLPIDALKIDRAFVSRLGTAPESSQVVRTIASLAHNLDLQLVAEGVETDRQLAELRALGCHFAQGFLFATPLDAARMEALLEGRLALREPAAMAHAG